MFDTLKVATNATEKIIATQKFRTQLDWIKQNVKDNVLAEEMRLTLVQDNPQVLAMLDDNEKTKTICETAFNADNSLISHIPSQYITKNIQETLLKNDPNYFQHLHNSLKTEEACISAVQFNPDNLQFVPEDKKTPAVLKATFEAMRNK